jgi:hypothetical protein
MPPAQRRSEPGGPATDSETVTGPTVTVTVTVGHGHGAVLRSPGHLVPVLTITVLLTIMPVISS